MVVWMVETQTAPLSPLLLLEAHHDGLTFLRTEGFEKEAVITFIPGSTSVGIGDSPAVTVEGNGLSIDLNLLRPEDVVKAVKQIRVG